MKLLVVAQLLQNTDSIRNAGYIAFALSVLAYFFYAWQTFWIYLSLCAIFLLCLLQHYVSIRIRFDSELLLLVATTAEDQNEKQYIEQKTKDLDRSLLELKLISAEKCNRSWDKRIQGCMQLFKFHIALVLCQYIVLISLMIFLLKQ